MDIAELFPAECVFLDVEVPDKTVLLDRLAGEGARRLGLAEAEVTGPLRAREKLGATGLGRGIAMPHARLDAGAPLGLVARLAHPVDYESRDEVPVDLVFLVLWPESVAEDFLPTLAALVRSLRDPELPGLLRAAPSAEAAHAALRRLAPAASTARPA